MSEKTTARTLLAVTALGLGLAWYIKKGKEDPRPLYDSLGGVIDYSHPISWIPPSTDKKIINEAYASWALEKKIKREKSGSSYVQKPFDINDYYGGYRENPRADPVVHIQIPDPGPGSRPFDIPVFQMQKNFML